MIEFGTISWMRQSNGRDRAEAQGRRHPDAGGQPLDRPRRVDGERRTTRIETHRTSVRIAVGREQLAEGQPPALDRVGLEDVRVRQVVAQVLARDLGPQQERVDRDDGAEHGDDRPAGRRSRPSGAWTVSRGLQAEGQAQHDPEAEEHGAPVDERAAHREQVLPEEGDLRRPRWARGGRGPTAPWASLRRACGASPLRAAALAAARFSASAIEPSSNGPRCWRPSSSGARGPGGPGPSPGEFAEHRRRNRAPKTILNGQDQPAKRQGVEHGPGERGPAPSGLERSPLHRRVRRTSTPTRRPRARTATIAATTAARQSR